MQVQSFHTFKTPSLQAILLADLVPKKSMKFGPYRFEKKSYSILVCILCNSILLTQLYFPREIYGNFTNFFFFPFRRVKLYGTKHVRFWLSSFEIFTKTIMILLPYYEIGGTKV